MKIIQIFGQIAGAGITRYISEMNNAFISAGHDVIAYFCQNENEPKNGTKKKYQSVPNAIKYDYSEESLKNINSADIVCVHELMPAKTNKKYLDPFMKLILEDINGPKKVFFMNGHTIIGYRNYFPIDSLTNKELLNSFDKIATFNHQTPAYSKVKETIGEEAMKKYIHMLHPYKFDDSCKDKWLSISDKSKRITYIGRWAGFKNPKQVQELHKYANKYFEFEMRGITRSIGTASTPDLFYEIGNDKTKSFKENIIGPSKYTEIINNQWYIDHNIENNDLLLDYPRNNKMFIFGPYIREDGLLAVSKASFGAEFYILKDKHFYGHNIEYCMMEIIEQGTILLADYFTGESIHMHENAKDTGKSMIDLNIGVFLKTDRSNIDEIVEQMNNLYNDEKLYNEMRNRSLEIVKKHTDPISVANNFIEEVFKM